jgi:hypothetical protein
VKECVLGKREDVTSEACQYNHVRISISKCDAMLFCPRRLSDSAIVKQVVTVSGWEGSGRALRH